MNSSEIKPEVLGNIFFNSCKNCIQIDVEPKQWHKSSGVYTYTYTPESSVTIQNDYKTTCSISDFSYNTSLNDNQLVFYTSDQYKILDRLYFSLEYDSFEFGQRAVGQSNSKCVKVNAIGDQEKFSQPVTIKKIVVSDSQSNLTTISKRLIERVYASSSASILNEPGVASKTSVRSSDTTSSGSYAGLSTIWMGWIPRESGAGFGSEYALGCVATGGVSMGEFQFDYRFSLTDIVKACAKINFPSGKNKFVSIAPNTGYELRTSAVEAFKFHAKSPDTETFNKIQASHASAYLNQALGHADTYGLNYSNSSAGDKYGLIAGSLWSFAIRKGGDDDRTKKAISVMAKSQQNNKSLEQILKDGYDTFWSGYEYDVRWDTSTSSTGSQYRTAINLMNGISQDDMYNICTSPGDWGGASIATNRIITEVSGKLKMQTYSQDFNFVGHHDFLVGVELYNASDMTDYNIASNLEDGKQGWKLFSKNNTVFFSIIDVYGNERIFDSGIVIEQSSTSGDKKSKRLIVKKTQQSDGNYGFSISDGSTTKQFFAQIIPSDFKFRNFGNREMIVGDTLDQESESSQTNTKTSSDFLSNALKSVGKTKSNLTGSQVIVVNASGNSAKLNCYSKNSSGNWVVDSSLSNIDGHVGRNGVSSSKSEGDGKTPSGLFGFGDDTGHVAFGNSSKPSGVSIKYTDVTNKDYFVDGSSGSSGYKDHYNQWYTSSTVVSGLKEHLCEYPDAYKYAIIIGYNMNKPTYGAGSAIFLHCGSSATSGCVSVSESNMIKLLKWLDSGAQILITQNIQDTVTNGIYIINDLNIIGTNFSDTVKNEYRLSISKGVYEGLNLVSELT